jgi:hypothetical protein
VQKLSVPRLIQKFPAFYGTRRCITAITGTHHLSLFSARSIQSMPPSHFLKIHFNILIPSTHRSSKWSVSLRPHHQNRVYTSPVSHTYHMPCWYHSSWLDHPNNIWWEVQSIKPLTMSSSSLPCQLVPRRHKYFPQNTSRDHLTYVPPRFLR